MYSVFLLLLLILQCNGHQDIHSSHSLVVYEVFQKFEVNIRMGDGPDGSYILARCAFPVVRSKAGLLLYIS